LTPSSPPARWTTRATAPASCTSGLPARSQTCDVDLHVQQWGEGHRTVVLVHGFTDDHTTWHRVAPHFVAQGFRVLAPDLRGHGVSPWCSSYRLADFADDLAACIPREVDLLVGHSLGALAVGLAAEDLAPRGLVYLDPPWRADL